jgi:hypothetical protein
MIYFISYTSYFQFFSNFEAIVDDNYSSSYVKASFTYSS